MESAWVNSSGQRKSEEETCASREKCETSVKEKVYVTLERESSHVPWSGEH